MMNLFYVIKIMYSCMILHSCTILLEFCNLFYVIIFITVNILLFILNAYQVVVPHLANLGAVSFTPASRSARRSGCGAIVLR